MWGLLGQWLSRLPDCDQYLPQMICKLKHWSTHCGSLDDREHLISVSSSKIWLTRASLAISVSIWVWRQAAISLIFRNNCKYFPNLHPVWLWGHLFILIPWKLLCSPSSDTWAATFFEDFVFIWKLFSRKILILLLATEKILEVSFEPTLALRTTFFVLGSKPQNMDFFFLFFFFLIAQRVDDSFLMHF